VIGVDLLVGRRYRWAGTGLGLAIVGLVLVLLVGATSWGLVPTVALRTDTFGAPVGNASAATVDLSFSVGEATVQPIADTSQLIAADITHVGDIEFTTTGDRTKTVLLRQKEAQLNDWTSWLTDRKRDQDYRWSIGLNPAVPTDLQVNGGLGDMRLDLQEMNLTGLRANGGAGDITIALPATEQTYDARINGGLGNVSVTISDRADINLQVNGGAGDGTIAIGEDAQVVAHINGGLGSYTVDVPDDAAVRITAQSGLGSVELPGRFSRTGGEGREGTWETEGFSRAEVTITLDYNGGAGGLTVR
jgi:hypothetical protein